MINFQALQGTLGVNVGPWRQGFASAEGVARGFVSRTSALFRGLFSAASGLMSIGTRIAKDMAIVGAAVASVGVIAAATSSKITASFEQSMARVDALTGASTRSAEEFQRLEDAAKKMGAETVFSARQASEAMQFFALAGFQTEEIIGALPHSLNLAAAGQIDIAEAADITSKVMKSMGLNVEDLASSTDVLTKAMTTANTDLTQLGEAFKQVGPIANAANYELEQTTSLIQALSDAGIQGESAGAGLKNILGQLAQETSSVRKVFGGLGVEVKDASGELRPMADIIDDFNRRLIETGRTAEKTGLVMQAFGLRGGPSMAVLLEAGGAQLRQMEKDLTDPGVAARIAGRQLDTMTGSVTLLKSILEALAILIGEGINPGIRASIDELAAWLQVNNEIIASTFVEWWNSLGAAIDYVAGAAQRSFERMLPFFGLIQSGRDDMVALVGQFRELLAITPEWIKDLATVATAIVGARAALGPMLSMVPFLGTAFSAIAAVLGGPVTLALGAVAVAGGVLIANWESISAWVNDNFGGTIAWLLDGWGKVQAMVGAAVPAAIQFLTASWGRAMDAINHWLAANERTINQWWDTIGAFVGAAINIYKAWGVVIWNTAQQILPIFWKALQYLYARASEAADKFFEWGAWFIDEWGPTLRQVAAWIENYVIKSIELLGVVISGLIDTGSVLLGVFFQLIDVFADIAGEVQGVLWEALKQIGLVIYELVASVGKLAWELGSMLGLLDENAQATDVWAAFVGGLLDGLKNLVTVVGWVLIKLAQFAQILTIVGGGALTGMIQAVGGLTRALIALSNLDWEAFKTTLSQTMYEVGKTFYEIPGRLAKVGQETANEQRRQIGVSQGIRQDAAAAESTFWAEYYTKRKQQQIESAKEREQAAALAARDERTALLRQQQDQEVQAAQQRGQAVVQAEQQARQQAMQKNRAVPGGGPVAGLGEVGGGDAAGIGAAGGAAPAQLILADYGAVAEAIRIGNEEVNGELGNTVAGLLDQLHGAINAGDDVLRGALQKTDKQMRATIKGIGKQLADAGHSFTADQAAGLKDTAQQIRKTFKEMANASGDNRLKLTADFIRLRGEYMKQMEVIKIGGGRAFEDLTKKQQQEIEKQLAQIDNQVKAALEKFGDLAEGAAKKMAEAQAAALGGAARGGINPGAIGQTLFGQFNQFVGSWFAQASNGIGEAITATQQWAAAVAGIEDPAARVAAQMDKVRAEIKMMKINYEQFVDSQLTGLAAVHKGEEMAKQRAAIAAKEQELQRLAGQKSREQELQDNQRLEEWQRRQNSQAQERRRLDEERALSGPVVDLFTGDSAPIDIGGNRTTSAATASSAGGATSNSFNIRMQFNEEVTPERARGFFDAIENEAKRRGVKVDGRTILAAVTNRIGR